MLTDSQGRFTISGVSSGGYTLSVAKGGYSSESRGVTVTADTTVAFNLQPDYQTVRRERTDELSQDSPVCSGGSKPCMRIDFPAHHSKDVSASVRWSSSDADISIELRCGEDVLASSSNRDITPVNGEDFLSIDLTGTAQAGRMCEVRAIHKSGVSQRVTLIVESPN